MLSVSQKLTEDAENITQLVECLPYMQEAQEVPSPASNTPSMVAHTCNPSAGKGKKGRAEAAYIARLGAGQPELHGTLSR
jgi:hypothetical protein